MEDEKCADCGGYMITNGFEDRWLLPGRKVVCYSCAEKHVQGIQFPKITQIHRDFPKRIAVDKKAVQHVE